MTIGVRPFLKWAGGKFASIPYILPHLGTGRCLIEPFVGSGAVFINTTFERYILNDINRDLITLYRTIKSHGTRYIVDAQRLFTARNNTETAYYRLRTSFNHSSDDYERSLVFLYLNRFGYNGLCRYNRQKQFNVPFGRYKKPYFPEAELHHFFLKAQKATFVNGNFSAALMKARPKDVVYCDPPYVPLSKTSKFTEFSSEGFDSKSQELLADQCRAAARRGVKVLVSNHDTGFTRRLYAGAKMRRIDVRRSINSNILKRGTVKELLAVYN